MGIHLMKYLLAISIALTTGFGIAAMELRPLPDGTFPVASTNMQIADKHMDISGEDMHEYLLGKNPIIGSKKYVGDLLKFPDSAWLTDINVPDDEELYGHVSGETFQVLSYITYPTEQIAKPTPYDFPYHNSKLWLI